MRDADPATAPGVAPALRVVGGSPSPEELAVVTAVLLAGGAGPADGPPVRERRGGWNDPASMLGAPPRPGPNAWRAALR